MLLICIMRFHVTNEYIKLRFCNTFDKQLMRKSKSDMINEWRLLRRIRSVHLYQITWRDVTRNGFFLWFPSWYTGFVKLMFCRENGSFDLTVRDIILIGILFAALAFYQCTLFVRSDSPVLSRPDTLLTTVWFRSGFKIGHCTTVRGASACS